MDADLVRHWSEVGARAVAGELSIGVRPADGTINSVTSAALVGTTLGLPSVGEAIIAQHIVRDGYLAARYFSGGPTSARTVLDEVTLEPRLFLLNGRWPEPAQLVAALLARFPFPSYVRSAWEERFVLSFNDDEKFAAVTQDFNGVIWKFGTHRST